MIILIIIGVVVGGMALSWIITRAPYIRPEDIDHATKETEGLWQEIVPVIKDFTGKDPTESLAFLKKLVDMPQFTAIEYRRQAGELIRHLEAAAQEIAGKLSQGKNDFAERAWRNLCDEINHLRLSLSYGVGPTVEAGQIEKIVNLLQQVNQNKERIFALTSLFAEARELLKTALTACQDEDCVRALQALRNRLSELVLADLSFTRPDEIRTIEQELKQAKQYLIVLLNQDMDANVPPSSTTGADPLSILDVDKTATKEEIRDAYHKKIAAYHPDKIEARVKQLSDEPEVQEKLRAWFTEQARQINDAYEKLKS
ncbi:MAG: J domain-containing protein [Candidatus Magasanikbacteria bacterium]|nr:J domain-containing protein [Candidatus Magasanikbacteria bacterium]